MADWLQYMEAGRRQRQEDRAIQRQNQLAQLASKAYGAPEAKQQGLIQSAIGVNPEAGFALSQSLQQDRTGRENRSREILGYSARLLTSVPPEARGGVYAKVRPQLEALGMQNLPMTYEEAPDLIDQTAQGIAQSVGMAGARVQSTKIDENGQIINIMSDGRIIPTGTMAENRSQIFKGVDEQGRPIFGAFDPRAGSVGGFGGAPQGGMAPQAAPQGGVIPTPRGQIEVSDPAAMQFLRDNPQVAAGLASGQPFDVPAQAPRSGMLVGPDPVAQAGAIASAQAQGRIGAELAAAPAQAQVAANLERVRELAKGEAGRENDRIANRTGMIIALNQADQSTQAISELVETSIEPLISNWTTGTIGSFISAIPGTAASDLEANLETLKAVAGFSELTALKARGGTLGALSEGERAALESLWGTLRNSQSPQAFRANLDRYMRRVNQAWENIAAEYELRYGESAPTAVNRLRAGTGGRQVVRTGTDPSTGRAVVQYADGSIEYGD